MTVPESDATTAWSKPQAIDYEAVQNSAHSEAVVYEFNGESGDVGPRDPEIEESLYGKPNQAARAGSQIDAFELQPTIEGPHPIKPFRAFSEAGLHPAVLENVGLCGYSYPTCVQAYTIPAIMQGHDVVAVAQTGSGKTAAYLIPILSSLMGRVNVIGGPRLLPSSHPDHDPALTKVVASPLVLIVCPTRELAHQIFDEVRRLSYRSRLRPVCVYGGVQKQYNIQQLSKGCDILIGTPGRLRDLMTNSGNIISMDRLRFTVIDEADEMLQQNWEEELGDIINSAADSPDHRFIMFSATFPKQARALAREYLAEDYIRIRIGRAGSSHKNVTQSIISVEADDKPEAVLNLLMTIPPCLTMIFCNSVGTVDRLDDFLYREHSLPTTFLHSKRQQGEREDAMRNFKLGKSPILITTGVTARGIDISGVGHVINFDLPSVDHGGIGEYVHRIGRTGRIGHKGMATSLFDSSRDEDLGPDLVKILRETDQTIPDFLVLVKEVRNGLIDFDDDTDEEDAGDGEPESTDPADAAASPEAVVAQWN